MILINDKCLKYDCLDDLAFLAGEFVRSIFYQETEGNNKYFM